MALIHQPVGRWRRFPFRDRDEREATGRRAPISVVDLPPRAVSHSASWCALLRLAVSSGVKSSYPIQSMSAPRWRRYSAAACWPPWHACQIVSVMASREGRLSAANSSSMRSVSPMAAACHRFVRAPRSTRRQAAAHCPNPTALSSWPPTPLNAPGASMWAPASSSASRASTSSLLAAQCSGVCSFAPSLRAFTSAPASTRLAMVVEPFGKCPGQSVATWSSVMGGNETRRKAYERTAQRAGSRSALPEAQPSSSPDTRTCDR